MANVYYSDRLVQVDEDKDSREYSDDAQMKTGNRNGDSQFDESSQAEAEEGSKESTEEDSIDDAQSSTDSYEEDYDKKSQAGKSQDP